MTRIFVLLLILFLSECLAGKSNVKNTSDEWNKFANAFLQDYFIKHPDFAVGQGRHEFDGKLPDFSEAGLQANLLWLNTEREKALAFNQKQLDKHQQFERDYLIAQIDKDIFWQKIMDYPHINPNFYFDMLDPDVYASRPYATLQTRMRSYTIYLHNIPSALQQIKATLKMPMIKIYVKAARGSIHSLLSFYTSMLKNFEGIGDKEMMDEFKKANGEAVNALNGFDTWLEGKENSSTGNYAFGIEKFSEMLRMTEGVDISIDKLDSIGRADLEQNTQALLKECNKLAPGKTIAECLQIVSANKVTGASLVDAVKNEVTRLRTFLQQKDIISIFPAGDMKIAQSPPYRSWNPEYVNTPGPYDKNLLPVFYVSLPDPGWTKEKQNDYMPGKGNLSVICMHEAYTGHILQYLHSSRLASKFDQVFTDYAFAEGWADYSQQMVCDAGYTFDDAGVRIEQLKDAIAKDIRLISAIGIHTRGMTIEESKEMFIKNGFMDSATAQRQANHGMIDPSYLNYAMGKLMINKLRNDWISKNVQNNSWKKFHDLFLSFGSAPIPLIRKAMMGINDNSQLL